MPEREQPMTQTMKASEARAQWSQLLNKVYRRQTRVVVEKSGVPVVAIVSAEDYRRLANLEAEREKRFGVIDRLRGRFSNVLDDELEAEVDRAFAAGRAKHPLKRPA